MYLRASWSFEEIKSQQWHITQSVIISLLHCSFSFPCIIIMSNCVVYNILSDYNYLNMINVFLLRQKTLIIFKSYYAFNPFATYNISNVLKYCHRGLWQYFKTLLHIFNWIDNFYEDSGLEYHQIHRRKNNLLMKTITKRPVQ